METKDIELNKEYWDKFYQSNFKHTPSQFCVCVLTEIPDNVVILELGSGNGRDSLYFASQGYQTIALDLSSQAIESCNKASVERNIEHVTFIQADLSKLKDVNKAVSIARSKAANAKIVFYSRFVMHSLDDAQEIEFLNNLSTYMQADELIYFEFRSKEDAKLDKYFGGHYRRYIDTDNFIQRLNNLNFKINYQLVGQGMAKYKAEDPFVARIIAQKL
ncbi:MAG: class I SAM-dependent methyltransferase [Proteobacteria bacterium]|nr:class I SAM-dependent methyltransferase [Pseudomonadota bacterium]